MSSSAAVVQLHHRETFERNVTRALVAGAGAGALAFLTTRLVTVSGAPLLTFLALVATSLACVRGEKLDRLVLAALSVFLPALPWLFGLSAGWTVALAGAAAGVLMVKSRLAEKGTEGSVGADRPGAVHYGLAAGATAGLAVAGSAVADVLNAQLSAFQTPTLLNFVARGAVVALFAGLGGLAAHVALKADPVEARGEELLPLLQGEFHDQVRRALTLYRQAGEQLAALPREPAREELARTLQRLTREAFDLAGEWAGVEAQLHDSAHADLEQEVAGLKKSAAASRDAVARRQLELAAASLTEELERLQELKLKRERIVAKLKSQVALLERARVSLIGMRSSHASIRAAEMSAVSRKLNALALSQADEAKLAHEVATSAELSAVEAQAAEARLRAQLGAGPAVAGPEAPAPVSEGEAGAAAPEPAATQTKS